MDISFKTPAGKFNFRVCAVIINEGRLLALHDERSPYFYLPGGRVQMGETLEAAVLRELREELLIDAKITRPLWLNQSFFTEDVTGESYHEICVYFLIDASGGELTARGDSFKIHEGEHTLDFEWLTFERVRSEYLYPLFIKERITNLPTELEILLEVQ